MTWVHIRAPMLDSGEPSAAQARGIGSVVAALVASGVLVNAYLAVVARNTSTQDYLYFSAFWSLSLLVGFGVFLPVEQELARLLHTSDARRQQLRAAVLVAAGLACLELLLVVAGAPILLRSLGHRPGTVAAVAVLGFVSAGQFVLRGTLIGLNRMRTYALILFVDAALRVTFALVLAAELTTDSSGYAWTLVAAIALAHLPLLFAVIHHRSALGSGGPPSAIGPAARRFARAAAPLLLGSLAAQILLNGLPVLVAGAASSSEQAAAAQFQAAFQLVRVPLFLAVPIQTTMLPALTALFNAADRTVLVRVVARFVGLTAAVATTGIVVAYAAGPQFLRLVYGPRYHFARVDLAVLTLGVALYLGLIVITQALVAASEHAKVAWSWLSGLCAAAVVFLAVPNLVLAAEFAFLAGAGLGWLVGTLQLPVWANGRKEERRST